MKEVIKPICKYLFFIGSILFACCPYLAQKSPIVAEIYEFQIFYGLRIPSLVFAIIGLIGWIILLERERRQRKENRTHKSN